MLYETLSIEEDTNRYRKFIKLPLFRNASRTLRQQETDAGGLTPAEVWTEVENLLSEMRTIMPEDREVMVAQMVGNVKRRVRSIRRDGEEVQRTEDEINRTVTCIFYCLALVFEATSKDANSNPHNDLLDAMVEEMIRMNNPVLEPLHAGIKADGTKFESREGHELIEENDPMVVEDEWSENLNRLIDYYADRVWRMVKLERKDAFNSFWEKVKANSQLSATLRKKCNVKGDEHKELGFDYNAKCIFNIYGMLYRKGFFVGSIKGETPLAKQVTGHYDKDTGDEVFARYEYFKHDQEGIATQFSGMPEDVGNIIVELIKTILKH